MKKAAYNPVLVGLFVVVAVLIIAALVIVMNMHAAPVQTSTVTSVSVKNTAVPTLTKHVATIIKEGATFRLGSIETNSIVSYIVEQLQLPAGMPVNATLSGAYRSTANVIFDVMGPLSYGAFIGLNEFNTTYNLSAQAEAFIENGVGAQNTSGSSFSISLYNTTLTPILENFTCGSYNFSPCTSGFQYPHYEYWLVFANYHKTLNETLTITQPVNVTYYTYT